MVKEKIKQYAIDPTNPILNWELGVIYYSNKHYGSALNFFLRGAELTEDKELSYKCLILCANCLYQQKRRPHSETGFILHAISLIPERPEAWFLYLRFFEEKKDWQECYTLSTITEQLCNFNYPQIELSEYPGEYGIQFIKAKSAFNIGRGEESRKLLQEIIDRHRHSMSANYMTWVEDEIKRKGDGPRVNHIIRYSSNRLKDFKFPFAGIETITSNYSQTYQDMFVLSVLKGKRTGTYLEVGSADPYHNSNTALLEAYGWQGVSIEIKPEVVLDFNLKRKNKAICADACIVDYGKLLNDNFKGGYVDYLQLDCEPSKTTFEILLSIPFDTWKFSIITYEHDHSMDMSRSYREKSRRYLSALGYVLLVNDIGPNDWFTYEDWWIHPDLVDSDTINKMKTERIDKVTKVEDYFLNC